jgi:hypothetical protein
VRLKSWRIAKFDPEMPVPNVIDYWTDWNGRYKLKATFNMSEDQNDRDYWTGEATSNTIEFDVKPALAGPERKLELLRSADAFWISIKGDGLCDLKFNAQTKGARKGLSTITVEQARLLIEKLDESGDLGRAVTLLTRNKNSSTRRVNVGFGFRINRSADISYSVEWPPDTSLVNRLRMLRQCIDGDAATQIDQAIDRIESAGKPPLETK